MIAFNLQIMGISIGGGKIPGSKIYEEIYLRMISGKYWEKGDESGANMICTYDPFRSSSTKCNRIILRIALVKKSCHLRMQDCQGEVNERRPCRD